MYSYSYPFPFRQVGAIISVNILLSYLQVTVVFTLLPPFPCCTSMIGATITTGRVARTRGIQISSHQHQRSFLVRRQVAENSSVGHLITSTQSNTIKRIQTLLTKSRKRTESQQVVVEGPRMVRDLYENPQTRPLLRQIVIAQDKWDVWAPMFHQQQQQQHNSHIQVLRATASVLQACTDTVTNQGILAVCDMPRHGQHQHDLFEPATTTATTTTNSEQQQQQPQFWLILDGVSDPGNVGTLLRSAWVTGVAGVIFLPDSCDPWNAKAVRSAMGATFHVPLSRVHSWNECVELFHSKKNHRVRIYAATMLQHEENDNTVTSSVAHYDVDWVSSGLPSGKLSSSSDNTLTSVALVIGSEGNGLTPPLRDAVQRGEITPVHVPMEPGMESLNAAVCGSVILFEYYRQVREQRRHES